MKDIIPADVIRGLGMNHKTGMLNPISDRGRVHSVIRVEQFKFLCFKKYIKKALITVGLDYPNVEILLNGETKELLTDFGLGKKMFIPTRNMTFICKHPDILPNLCDNYLMSIPIRDLVKAGAIKKSEVRDYERGIKRYV